MVATGKDTVGGPPVLGVHVTVWWPPERVRMPSFFLYSVRPTGVAMVIHKLGSSGQGQTGLPLFSSLIPLLYSALRLIRL